MLSCIDVKFIFDSVRLGLSSSANILQIADVALRVVFLLFLLFLAIITSAEREVKVSRRSGMYQSYNFLTRLGMQSL